MNSSRWQINPVLLLVALLIVGIVFNELGWFAPVRSGAVGILAPVQRLFADATGSVRAWIQTLREMRDLQRRYEELKAEYDALVIENAALREVEQENERLRALLEFAERYPTYAWHGAQVRGNVIGRNPDLFEMSLIIDVGSRDGIDPGMPVVTDRGVVGRIRDVGPNWARVLLLIDPSSSVSAVTQTSRASGVVEGQVDGTLRMEYIPQDVEVVPGEIVVTSGLGGGFPRGLVMGQVVEVYRHDVEPYQSALVYPSVDFEALDFVLVLTDFEVLMLPEE